MTDYAPAAKFEGNNRQLAQRAMDAANLANQRMSGHEALCAERYENIDQLMRDIKTALAGLWKIVLSSAGVLILGMAAILMHQVFGIPIR